jgi:hypothetical protein
MFIDAETRHSLVCTDDLTRLLRRDADRLCERPGRVDRERSLSQGLQLGRVAGPFLLGVLAPDHLSQ